MEQLIQHNAWERKIVARQLELTFDIKDQWQLQVFALCTSNCNDNPKYELTIHLLLNHYQKGYKRIANFNPELKSLEHAVIDYIASHWDDLVDLFERQQQDDKTKRKTIYTTKK